MPLDRGRGSSEKIWAWENGLRLKEARARVDLRSPAWLEGRSLFETVLVHPRGDTGLYLAGMHAERLVSSARRLGWHGAPSSVRLVEWMREAAIAFRREMGGFGRLRATVAWTSPHDPPQTLVTVVPYTPPPDPARVGLTPVRVPWSDGAGAVKSGARLEYARAQAMAGPTCDEALLVDAHGRPVEGARSNLFVVVEGRLVTAPSESGVLAGVTRAEVIALARRIGLEVALRPVELDEWEKAHAAFLTNALWGVRPVSSLDGRSLDPAHPIAAQISREFARGVERALIGSDR